MIDIHTHILPWMDDGAADIYETLEMAAIAAESGVRKIVATPHCNIPGVYENYFGETYLKTFEKAREAIRREGIPVELLPGTEAFATYNLPELIVDKKVMPLNQSRYVLMEFSFDEDPGYAKDILQRVKAIGALPVIAHAERYEFVQDYQEIAREWVNNGYVIQVNKGSFMGRFGRHAKTAAYSLLDSNLVSVVASDAHGAGRRTPYMLDAYEKLSEEYPQETLQRIFRENPARICNNQPLMVQRPVPF